jgi:hypothetical protein
MSNVWVANVRVIQSRLSMAARYEWSSAWAVGDPAPRPTRHAAAAAVTKTLLLKNHALVCPCKGSRHAGRCGFKTSLTVRRLTSDYRLV